jgi:ankyrin repeat protein
MLCRYVNYFWQLAPTLMLQLEALRFNVELAKFLVEVGANVNTSSIRTNALQLAVSNNNLDLVNFFLDEGASVDASVAGQTALQTAANLENLELVKNLIDRGADTDAKFPDSLTTTPQCVATLRLSSILSIIELRSTKRPALTIMRQLSGLQL